MNESCAEVVAIAILGVTNSVIPAVSESSVNAAFGWVSDSLVVVDQGDNPLVEDVVQFNGNCGGATVSKFCVNVVVVTSCPRGMVKLKLPRFADPSCNCSVAVM